MAPPKRIPPPTGPSFQVKIIEAITAPLGFFVLALLIVEGFLGTVLVWAGFEAKDKITGMYLGVGMFVLVVAIVAVIDWFRPSNLTFDKEAHLLDRGKLPYGTDSNLVDRSKAIDDKKEAA